MIIAESNPCLFPQRHVLFTIYFGPAGNNSLPDISLLTKDEEFRMTENLTSETFKEKVFDYQNEEKWKYKGTIPGIIDFYADWCAPCKIVAPIIEELARNYEGRLNVWKVDTDVQAEIAREFKIQSIPSILFIPLIGEPRMHTGALSKTAFQEIIKDELGLD